MSSDEVRSKVLELKDATRRAHQVSRLGRLDEQWWDAWGCVHRLEAELVELLGRPAAE
jgi:hypothetical protein